MGVVTDWDALTKKIAIELILQILADKNISPNSQVDNLEEIAEEVIDIVSPYLAKRFVPQDPDDNPEWMIEIANLAVQQNLKEDGSCKYETAQGYACALSAVRLMNSYIPPNPFSPKRSDNRSFDQDEKMGILSAAKEIYDFHRVRFGESSAVKQVIVFVAEKYGIVDWTDLGLHPEQEEDIRSMVTKHFEGMTNA